MSNEQNNKKYSAAIFWAAFLVIIITLFGIFTNRIYEVLASTEFFPIVFGSEPVFMKENLDKARERIAEKSKKDRDEIPPAAVETPPAFLADQKAESAVPALETAVITEEKKIDVKIDIKTMKVIVYYVHIDGNGTVIRKETERKVPQTAALLKASIEELLSGPNEEETSRGIVSLIPQGTKLISASINNRVASLNFSDEFLYNKFGVEGYIGQLMQIVYTATSFQSIDSVQFLVDGHMKEFLGNESVWVGSPLARSTFK